MEKKKSLFVDVLGICRENKTGVIVLAVSTLVMCVVNTFLLPYVITALMNGTSVKWYQYVLSVVLTVASLGGMIWAAFLICKNGKRRGGIFRFVCSLLIYAAAALLLSVVFSFVTGLIGESWYYILKNIIAAKVAIDITARVLNVPFTAALLCVLGNVLVGRTPLLKIGVRRFHWSMLIAAIYALVEYLLVLPSTKTWFLAVACVVNAILYTAMIIATAALAERELEAQEKAAENVGNAELPESGDEDELTAIEAPDEQEIPEDGAENDFDDMDLDDLDEDAPFDGAADESDAIPDAEDEFDADFDQEDDLSD